MQPGEKYLKGKLDLGAFGEADILVFKNEHKKEEKHPDHVIYLSQGDGKPKKIGALWVNVKKESEPQPVLIETFE